LSNPLRFALLGCGRVSGRYLEVFNDELKNAALVACCDLNASKSKFVASQSSFDTIAYTDWQKMLNNSKPDIVCVLTESGNHEQNVQDLLNANMHVLVEKPVIMNPDRVNALIETADAKHKMLTCVFQNRWNPAIKAVKRAYENERFGRIITATIRLRWCRYQDYYEDGWHGTWAMDGGVINQQAIHHIDALDWICGPIEDVCAMGSNRLMKLEAEDTLVGIIKFKDGALGTIEATTAARPNDIEASLSIVGEQGTVVVGGIALNQIEEWSFIDPLPEDETATKEFSQQVPTGYGLGHGPYLQEVTDRLLNGNFNPVLNANDAVKAIEVNHALYASWETGGWASRSNGALSAKLGK